MAGKTAVLSVRILGDGKDARRALRGTSKDVSLLQASAQRLKGGLGGLTKFAGGFTLIGTAVGASTLAIKTLLPVLLSLGAALGGALVVGAAALIVPLMDIGKHLGDLGPKFQSLGKQMSGSFWAEAATPIRDMVNSLLPALSDGLTRTSQIMGAGLGGAAKQVQATLGPMLPDLLGKFNEFWSGAMSGLGPFLNGLFQLMDAGSVMLPLVGDGLAVLGTQFEGWASKLNESGQVASLFQTSMGTISSVFETLAPAIGSVIGLFETTYTAVAPLIGALAGALGPAISAIAAALGPVVQSLAGALLPAVQMLAPVLGGVLVTGVQLFANVLMQLAPIIGQLLTAIVPFVAQLAGMLMPVISQLISTLLPPLVTLFAGLVPIITSLLTALMPLVSTLISALAPVLMQLGPLLAVLVQGFLQVVGAVAPLIPLLVGALVPVIQAIAPLLSTVVSVLTSLLGPAIQMIVGIIQIVVGVLTGDWTMAWEGVKTVVTGAINLVKAVVKGGLTLVKSIFTTVLNLIKAKVTSVFNMLPQPVQRALQKFKTYFTTGFNAVLNIVKSLPGRIKSALGNLGALLVNSGAALMRGFTNGIKRGISAAVNAAKSAVQRVRDFFPFSPAKRGPFSGSGYTTHSGKALVRDFAGAMTKEIVKVRSAAAKVATAGTINGAYNLPAMRAGAPAAANRAGGAGTTVEVNFNGVVTDPLAVARELRRLLDRYDVVMGTA